MEQQKQNKLGDAASGPRSTLNSSAEDGLRGTAEIAIAEGDTVVCSEDHYGERLWNCRLMPDLIGTPVYVEDVRDGDALCRPPRGQTFWFQLKWLSRVSDHSRAEGGSSGTESGTGDERGAQNEQTP